MIAYIVFEYEEWARFLQRDPLWMSFDEYFSDASEKAAFEQAYHWVDSQMKQRVSDPPVSGACPIKIYLRWEGDWVANREMIPELIPPSGDGVAVWAEVPHTDVLLANEDLWLGVLNHWYIPRDSDDEQRHEKFYSPYPGPVYARRLVQDTGFQNEIVTSRDRIILDTKDGGADLSHVTEENIIGWIWTLARSNITRVERLSKRPLKQGR